MKRSQRLLIILFSILGFQQAQATNFVGVVSYYECLSPTLYRLHHHAYRHCHTTPPPGGGLVPPGPPAGFSINTHGGSCNPPVYAGNWTLVNMTDVTPICPGVLTSCYSGAYQFKGTVEVSHYKDIDFSAAGTCTQVSIDWNGCCRNGRITSGLAFGGVFQRIDINLGISPCNNSPIILATPRPVICAGTQTRMSLNTFDVDGDSLKYSLVPCQTAAGVYPTYASGYGVNSPLGPTWQVQLDSMTGELLVTPLLGDTTAGQICVQIEEFRNGNSIGTIGMELLLDVTSNCTGSAPNSPPSIDQLQVIKGGIVSGNWEITMCQGDTLIFQVGSSDANPGQSLTPEFFGYFNDLSVSYTGGNPMLTEYVLTTDRPEDFYFPIIVWDDYCPMKSSAVKHILVKVGNTCIDATPTAANCGSPMGSIDLHVWGGIGPYQFLWNTGATTEDITNLVPGIYTVQVTDANNRVFVDSFIVNALNISINPTLTLPNCADQQGMIHTNITGATPPFTYLWNTGDTSDSLANLSSGGYSLTIIDNQGCPRHEAFLLKRPDSCINIIEGRYYEDLNGNCQFDWNDIPQAYKLIQVSPGIDVLTDANGFYRLELDTGSFTWNPFPNPFQQSVCPPSSQYQMSFLQTGDSLTNVDFAVQTDSILDQRVSYTSSRARPGMGKTHLITVYNDGNLSTQSTLTWTHDSIFEWLYAVPPPSSYDSLTRTATWTFNQPRSQRTHFQAFINTRVAVNAGIGTPFSSQAIVYPIQGDSTPTNNSFTQQGITSGSFDPNDKQVNLIGQGSFHSIPLETKRLSYTVRFQNTGTDTAFFVVIRDTIDPNLKITSFQRESESHPYQMRIEEDSILIFSFNRILLPDSSTNLASSQGFVQFSFLVKDNLSSGAQIRNRAAIYFDFNEPIITNEVLNTLAAFPKVTLGKDSAFCEGEMLTAELFKSGTPPYTFSWNNGVVDANNFTGKSSIQITSPGLYQLTVTDSLGISHAEEMNVTILPPPDAFFSFLPNGRFTSFNSPSTANINWFWDFGDGHKASGQQNPVHLYASNGVYQVTLVTVSYCGFDTSSQTVTISSLGLAENPLQVQPEIVPHPVKDVSYLRFENAAQQLYELQIFDLQGRLIQAYPPQRGDAFEIRKDNLATGMYMYQLTQINGSESHFGKIMVK